MKASFELKVCPCLTWNNGHQDSEQIDCSGHPGRVGDLAERVLEHQKMVGRCTQIALSAMYPLDPPYMTAITLDAGVQHSKPLLEWKCT